MVKKYQLCRFAHVEVPMARNRQRGKISLLLQEDLKKKKKKKKNEAGATFDGEFVYLNIVCFDVVCISLERLVLI